MKKFTWPIVLSFLVLIGGISAFVLISSYKADAELLDFPVPQSATLVEENEFGKNYDWPKASGDNEIPWSYQWALKLNDWEKVKGELTPIYQQDDKKIDLITTTDHLSILKVE
ncbi:hypothetical protein [Planomicrobium sp. Y74]|uniref:hypothetical protein n=1 Tax=Planomicrobium sp. Y74 TaxID=2478977 RepID=UPI000EF43D33|nr:hypothetical protein [Planomicrobium sp. Y74]RLQ89883.1 hypothetical protein D9754_13910 [Planomicrobium sp. Y74]